MSVCPVLLQSQSVPVIPLKGTTPEATQVWETVLCWPAYPTSPPISLPAQSATSVHTGDRASINQTRAHRLKTLWHSSVFKNFFGILERQSKEFLAQKKDLFCWMWKPAWGEVRKWGFKCSQKFTGHTARALYRRGNEPHSKHIPAPIWSILFQNSPFQSKLHYLEKEVIICVKIKHIM